MILALSGMSVKLGLVIRESGNGRRAFCVLFCMAPPDTKNITRRPFPVSLFPSTPLPRQILLPRINHQFLRDHFVVAGAELADLEEDVASKGESPEDPKGTHSEELDGCHAGNDEDDAHDTKPEECQRPATAELFRDGISHAPAPQAHDQ